MLPDSVSWGRGFDRPLVVFRPDTAGGHFEGVLGTSAVKGNRLVVDDFTPQQAKFIDAAIQNQATDSVVIDTIISSRVRACAEATGAYVLQGCNVKAAIVMNGGLRSSRVSESTIVEVND